MFQAHITLWYFNFTFIKFILNNFVALQTLKDCFYYYLNVNFINLILCIQQSILYYIEIYLLSSQKSVIQLFFDVRIQIMVCMIKQKSPFITHYTCVLGVGDGSYFPQLSASMSITVLACNKMKAQIYTDQWRQENEGEKINNIALLFMEFIQCRHSGCTSHLIWSVYSPGSQKTCRGMCKHFHNCCM